MAKTSPSDHKFIVDLTGLNLPPAHLQRINTAIQRAVIDEIGSVDLHSLDGGFVFGFRRPPICGIIYRPQLENIEDF
jgi:hypothetical protein